MLPIDADKVSLLNLPSLPLSCRKQFPSCPAIYFVLAAEKVLYVGRTINLVNRWAGHHRLAELENIEEVKIAWMEVNDFTLLPSVEKVLIQYLKPTLNNQPVKIRRQVDAPTVNNPGCSIPDALSQAPPERKLTKDSIVQFVETSKRCTPSAEEHLFSMRGSLLLEFASVLKVRRILIIEFAKTDEHSSVNKEFFYEPPNYALLVRRDLVLAILDSATRENPQKNNGMGTDKITKESVIAFIEIARQHPSISVKEFLSRMRGRTLLDFASALEIKESLLPKHSDALSTLAGSQLLHQDLITSILEKVCK